MYIFIFLIIFSTSIFSHAMEERRDSIGFSQRFISWRNSDISETNIQNRYDISRLFINNEHEIRCMRNIDPELELEVYRQGIQKMIQNSPVSELVIRECIVQSWENQNTFMNRAARRLGRIMESSLNLGRQIIIFIAGYGTGTVSEKVTRHCPSCTLF